MPDKLWTEVSDTVSETGIKTSPKKKKCKKAKWVWGGLTNSCEKKRSEQQEGNGKIYPSECRGPRIARRDIRKPSSVINEKK